MAWYRFSNLMANTLADAISALIDAGATGGKVKLYNNDPPATVDLPVTSQTLLATLTFSTDSYQAATSGFAQANTILSGTGVAAGNATWARLEDSDGNALMDGNVDTSDAFVVIASTDIQVGAAIEVELGTITVAKER